MRKINYKITIPGQPDSINQVTSYGKNEGDLMHIKKKWEKIAFVQLQEELTEDRLPIKFRGVIGLHFKLYFELNRRRDDDNYTLMCKGILDAFVKMGMIEDDSNEFVQDNGRRLIIDPERPRVVVYITEKLENEDVPDINYLQKANKINYVKPKIPTSYN